MNTYNCSVSCEGIYADVEWFKDNKGNGRDKLKYKRLISEYNTFKRNIVQHFKFDPANDSTMFRKLQFYQLNMICLKAYFRRGGPTLNNPAGSDLLQHSHLRRHRERQEDQDRGPAESHWRHHGTPDWLLHHQWGRDHLLSLEVKLSTPYNLISIRMKYMSHSQILGKFEYG